MRRTGQLQWASPPQHGQHISAILTERGKKKKVMNPRRRNNYWGKYNAGTVGTSFIM